MPLNKRRNINMDVKINIITPSTVKSATGGPKQETVINGPYWAAMEYLSRKQMETEVDTRITSFQQIRFTLRYTDALMNDVLSKAGWIQEFGGSQEYNIISISKDLGRKQFIQIVTELKE